MGIHKFKLKEKYILLDINSSNVFEIDELISDLLDYYPKNGIGELSVLLKQKYSLKEIEAGVKEIDQLICSNRLFCKEYEIDTSKLIRHGVKAMCLNVSHDCNLACEYCFASDNTVKREHMPIEVAKAAIDYLIENSPGRRNVEVDFFGGEPLMNFDVVKQTVEYARVLEVQHKKNFRFTLTTNAVLLNDDVMQYVNENMKNIVLSIDGRKKVNDLMRPFSNGASSYDIILPKIIKAVKQRENQDYFVRATFTANNLDFAEDVKSLADLGLKNLSAEPVVTDPINSYAITEKHIEEVCLEYEKLMDLYLDYRGTENEFNFFHFNIDLDNGGCLYKRISGCGAGCEYVAVDPKGDIYPCHQFVGNTDFHIGNVLNNEIKNVEVVNQFGKNNVINKQKCIECWAKFFCGGGCHANAYNMSGSIDADYEIGCEMHKKRLECALYIKCSQ